MATLHIRNFDEDMKLSLKFQADNENRSLSDLVREILYTYAKAHMPALEAWQKAEWLREEGLRHEQEKRKHSD